MSYLQNLKGWNWLMQMLEKIQDPKTKKLYKDSLLLKAIESWGFNPERPQKITEATKPMLTKEEERLCEIIKIYNEYGIDIRTEDEKNESQKRKKEFLINMYEFVKNGGRLIDLPEDLLKSKYATDTYFQMVKKLYDV